MKVKKNEGEVQVRIYDQSEHNIGNSPIDPDALKIIQRLQRKGYKAYVVGGAVRDLLMGIVPKDYDLATDATPTQMQRMFGNCRVIGRRFRLIHVYFRGNKIIEVATFRSDIDVNAYGRIEQDARRRDFTLNALYYDPQRRYLIDYVGGYGDIRAGKIVPVLPIETIFSEDPVRMVRAVKYAVGTGTTIVKPLVSAIRRDAALLGTISSSRLTEEVIKIVSSGKARDIMAMLHTYALLRHLQPELDALLKSRKGRAGALEALGRLDAEHAVKRHKGAGTAAGALRNYLVDYLGVFSFDFADSDKKGRLAMAKRVMQPITPPNMAVSEAIERLYRRRKSEQKGEEGHRRKSELKDKGRHKEARHKKEERAEGRQDEEREGGAGAEAGARRARTRRGGRRRGNARGADSRSDSRSD